MTDAPIYSDFGPDSDLHELVCMLVEELPARIDTLQSTFDSGDDATLRRTAHQLKGALGSYGFPSLTPYAAALERAIDASQPREVVAAAHAALVATLRRIQIEQPDHAI